MKIKKTSGANVPVELKRFCQIENAKNNRKRLKFALFVTMIILSVSIIIYSLDSIFKSDLKSNQFHIIIDVIFLLIVISATFSFYFFFYDENKYLRFDIFLFVLCFLTVIWSATISIYDREMTVFALTIVVIAMIFSLKPIFYFGAVSGITVLMLIMFIVIDDPNITLMEYVIISICSIISIFICSVIYRNSMEIIINKKRAEDEKFNVLLLDKAPLCTMIIDNKFNVIDCNEKAIQLFGYNDKAELQKNYLSECFPKYQNDGEESSFKANKLIDLTLKENSCSFEWLGSDSSGTEIELRVTLVKLGKNQSLIAVYMQDMREHYKLVNNLKENSFLLETVNKATTTLLSKESGRDFNASIFSGMELIRKNLSADVLYILKFKTSQENSYLECLYKSTSEIGKKESKIKPGTEIPYEKFERMEIKLSAGETINGPLSELPKNVKEIFSHVKIKSVLMMPIFIEKKFWGVLNFSDCQKERNFSEDEINILSSAGVMLATAIIRNDEALEMRETEERTKIMLDSAPLSAQIWNRKLETIDCNEAAVKLYGYKDKKDFIEKFASECSPKFQPDGELSDEKMVKVVNQAFEEGNCTLEWLHVRPDGALMPAEVTLVRVKAAEDYIVIGYTRDLRDIRNLESNIKELKTEADKAYIDALTGVNNRRALDNHLKQQIKILSRSKSFLTVMMIDIDFFKEYNDTYGHSAGDECLKLIAEAFLNNVRRSVDFVARYGGEEFVLVLANTNEEGSKRIAEKLLDSVKNLNITHEKSNIEKFVTISIGLTTTIADYKHKEEDYFKKADEALYRAKRGGRNKYTYLEFD